MSTHGNPDHDDRCAESSLHRDLLEKVAVQRLLGRSPAFLAQTEKIPIVAGCDVSVLISGETGTGKEMVARAIHYLSPRAKGPFIPINCGAIPHDLVESELFGHERGAFTGATEARAGLAEEADSGSLLLDEIDSLPLAAQVKLLRFLQDREYRRLGSSRVHKSDVRVIAATNADVAAALAEGHLRRDLYYRLSVVTINLPPLRERREDIPLLARHFLARFAPQHGRRVAGFTDEALRALVEHDWPGNVRELEHAVQRAVLLSGGVTLIPLTEALLPAADREPRSFKQAKARTIARFERDYLEKLLTVYGGNISRAARAAEKNRRAFWELLRKHHIDVRRFKPAAAAR